jgi:hypothetical protein
MTDAEQNFVACIKTLESFHLEYIQSNKQILETRSPIPVQSTTSVYLPSSIVATQTPTPVVINDYVRLCRMYCVMLWTYWEALKIQSAALEELRLTRNCIIHHEGDLNQYSQASGKFGVEGNRLINLSNGKLYVHGNHIVLSDNDLIDITLLVKREFTNSSGISF